MNVLICTHHYPAPEALGLVPDTKVVHYFARMLMEKGHRVQVIHLAYHPVKEISLSRLRAVLPVYRDYDIEGVPVHLMLYQMLTPRRFYPEGFQARLINAHLRRLKKRFVPDQVFIHFPTTFTGLTELMRGCPHVLGDFHNMDVTLLKERDKSGRVRAFIRQIPVWGYRNKNVHSYLRDELGGSPVPVYTGIDASLLAPGDFIDEKKRRRPDTLRLIYAGQLIPLKNVDCLILAFSRLSFDAELTIIGDGPERAQLEALAGNHPAITFTGWLPREQVIEKMKDADVFVMVSSPETYGMVYLEAMAQGCIAVASRGEGFDGLIRDGENGFLCAPGDEDELLLALERIAQLPTEERSRLIDAAYTLAISMTEDKTTEGFLRANAGGIQSKEISQRS